MQMAYSIVFFCLCGDFELVVDNCFTGQVKSSISYIPKRLFSIRYPANRCPHPTETR